MGHHKERLATRPEIEHPTVYTDGDLFEFLLSVIHVLFSRMFGRYLKMLEQHIIAVVETVLIKADMILIFFNCRADSSLIRQLGELDFENRTAYYPNFYNEVSFLFTFPINIYNTFNFGLSSTVFNLTNLFSNTSILYFNWVNVLGLSTIYNLNIYTILLDITNRLNFTQGNILDTSANEISPFQSHNIAGSNLNDTVKFANSELSTDFRYQRVLNPVFSYDYKVGNYATQHTTDHYKHLFVTFAELTGGVRKPS